tara:strand:+ start:163 stop:1344 length:1182 start_codon:yes stop_codon:yes gene_type:complete
MKIGLVIPGIPNYSETFFKSKIINLQRLGHEVIIFTVLNEKVKYICKVIPQPKINKYKSVQIINVIYLCMKMFLLCPFICKKFLYLEKNDNVTFKKRIENLYINSHILISDLDWVHFGFLTMAIRRENVAKAMNIKMGASIRGYDICIHPLKNPECYNRVWKRLDKLHYISKDLLNVAYNYGLNKNSKVSYIPPSINTDYFSKSIKTERLPIKYPPIKILSIARLHWKKGLEYTIQALHILDLKKIDFKYEIIGIGDEFERLVFAVDQLDLNDKVYFLGEKPKSDIKKYLNDADIYLQYSIQEGFCNSVLEAQSMGIPTIVSDAEGLSQNVIHGVTGWVVPKMKPNKLASSIYSLVKMREQEIHIISKNSIKHVKDNFDLNLQIEKLSEFFES